MSSIAAVCSTVGAMGVATPVAVIPVPPSPVPRSVVAGTWAVIPLA